MFRQACRWLCAEPLKDDEFRHYVLNLSWPLIRLGHAELSRDKTLQIAPGLLVEHPDGHADLCGARLPHWREALRKVPGIRLHIARQFHDRGPERWRLQATDAKGLALASAALGLRRAPEAGLSLLRGLPNLSEALLVFPETPPTSRPVEQFRWSRRAASWHSGPMGANGLYRITDAPHEAWYLRIDGRTCRIDGSESRSLALWHQIGRVEALQLNHHAEQQVLTLPATGHRLPSLLDRALHTASGLMPRYADRAWHYSNIALPRARECARILEANLKELP